jgi:hypothetical protein
LQGKTEQILIRAKNLTLSENASENSAAPNYRAAAVLGLSLDTLGLAQGSSNSPAIHGSDAMDLLDAVLRAVDRDHTLNSTDKAARAAVYEAIQAHRTLKAALNQNTPNPLPTSETVRARCAPHTFVEKGFLGKRVAVSKNK